MYDVVIVGGSFAGLATAMPLRDYRVLIVDQRAIGSHQTSTCGVPLPAVRAVGAETAILETSDTLVMHTGGETCRYPLSHPFATLDYAACCHAMLSQTTADVHITRATAMQQAGVETKDGFVAARFVVDASGWQQLSGADSRPARARAIVGYGIETELPITLGEPGLHFYVEKPLTRQGYAWAFPCGQTTRLGICTFDKGVALGPLLRQFVARFGGQVGTTHGGVLAVDWCTPRDGIFVVGDAAGHCLPLTAEGIRPALLNGLACGRSIAAALAAGQAAASAHAAYRAHLTAQAGYHRRLLRLQRAVAVAPAPLVTAASRLASRPPLRRVVVDHYLRHSGWLAPAG